MLGWWIGILVVLAVFLVLAIRRPQRRSSGAIAQDLFEGILPCAITGSSPHPKPRDGWELRWADVANLTPAGTDAAPHAGDESEGAMGKARADEGRETDPVAVDASTRDTVVRSSP